MKPRARRIAGLVVAVVLLLGPVAVYLSVHGGHNRHTWQILGGIYLFAFALPANIIGTRRWFRERDEEHVASDAFAQQVERQRLTR